MAALFTINQITKPPGVLGRARNDISLGTITVSCPDLHVSYQWAIASAPEGVSPVISTPTLSTTDILLSETGSYIISLTVDASLRTEQTVESLVGIILPNMLLPIPAAWETNQDNSIFPHTGERGSADKLTAIFKWIDANGGGGGGYRLRTVLDYVDCTAAPPSLVEGDRYILDDSGAVDIGWGAVSALDVVELTGGVWIPTTPKEGYIAYVAAALKECDYQFVDDGTPGWEPRPTTATSLQFAYETGQTIAATSAKGPISFSVADSGNVPALTLTQNDVTTVVRPNALDITSNPLVTGDPLTTSGVAIRLTSPSTYNIIGAGNENLLLAAYSVDSPMATAMYHYATGTADATVSVLADAQSGSGDAIAYIRATSGTVGDAKASLEAYAGMGSTGDPTATVLAQTNSDAVSTTTATVIKSRTEAATGDVTLDVLGEVSVGVGTCTVSIEAHQYFNQTAVLSLYGDTLRLYDVNKAGSTYASDLLLSATSSEWDDFVTNYGEASLLNALNNAGIFQAGVGVLSSKRRNASILTDADYSFGHGLNNTIETLNDYSFVHGSGNRVGIQSFTSPNTTVFGHKVTIIDSMYPGGYAGGNFIISPQSLWPNGRVFLGASASNVSTSPVLYSSDPIPDAIPQVGIAEIDGDLYEYSSWSNTPNGEFVLANPPTLARDYSAFSFEAGALDMTASFLLGAGNLVNKVMAAIVIGVGNTISGSGYGMSGALVFGGFNEVSGDGNFILGAYCEASGNSNLSLGYTNVTTGDWNCILGQNNEASSTYANVFGEDNIVSGNFQSVIGMTNDVGSEYVSVFGYDHVIDSGGEFIRDFGVANQIGQNSAIIDILGYGNQIQTCTFKNSVFGGFNVLQDGSWYNTLIGDGNTIGAFSGGNYIHGGNLGDGTSGGFNTPVLLPNTIGSAISTTISGPSGGNVPRVSGDITGLVPLVGKIIVNSPSLIEYHYTSAVYDGKSDITLFYIAPDTLAQIYADEPCYIGSFVTSSVIIGHGHTVGTFANNGTIDTSLVLGLSNNVQQSYAFVMGQYNFACPNSGTGPNIILGAGNAILDDGVFNLIWGYSNEVTGYNHTVFGQNNTVDGVYNVVFNDTNSVTASFVMLVQGLNNIATDTGLSFILGDGNIYNGYGFGLCDIHGIYNQLTYVGGSRVLGETNVIGDGLSPIIYIDIIGNNNISVTGMAQSIHGDSNDIEQCGISRVMGSTNTIGGPDPLALPFVVYADIVGELNTMEQGSFGNAIRGVSNNTSYATNYNEIIGLRNTVGYADEATYTLDSGNTSGNYTLIVKEDLTGTISSGKIIMANGESYRFISYDAITYTYYLDTPLLTSHAEDEEITAATCADYSYWQGEDNIGTLVNGFVNGARNVVRGVVGFINGADNIVESNCYNTTIHGGSFYPFFGPGSGNVVGASGNAVWGSFIFGVANQIDSVGGSVTPSPGGCTSLATVFGAMNQIGTTAPCPSAFIFGSQNTMDSSYGVSLYGNENVVSGSQQSLVLGWEHTVTDIYYSLVAGHNLGVDTLIASIVVGEDHVATGSYQVVFGYNNRIDGGSGNIVCGKDNTLTFDKLGDPYNTAVFGGVNLVGSITGGFVAGENHIVANCNYCAVFGNSNIVGDPNSDYSMVFGMQAAGFWQGALVHAAGQYSYGSIGDSQNIVEVELWGETNDDSWTNLFLDGTGATYKLVTKPDTSYQIHIMVSAHRQDAAGQVKAWEITALVLNDTGTTTLIGDNTTVIASTAGGTEVDWDVRCTANDTDETIQIEVLGSTSELIHWQASVKCVQLVRREEPS